MAHDGHIRHKNYEFTSVRGPVPTFAFSHVLDPHFEDLDPMVYAVHTLGTAFSGNILEFTYVGGPVPFLITRHGQIFHPES